jgi:hypothetical protein
VECYDEEMMEDKMGGAQERQEIHKRFGFKTTVKDT